MRAYCYPLTRLDLLQFVLAWVIRQTEWTSIVQQTQLVNGSSFLEKKREKKEKMGRLPCYATISLQRSQNLDISLLHTKTFISSTFFAYSGAEGLEKSFTVQKKGAHREHRMNACMIIQQNS